jgi:signal transduction histidine kinase
MLVQGVDVTSEAEADRTRALDRARLDYATRLSGVGFWYCDLPFDGLQWDERVKDHFFFDPTARVTIDDFYARIHEEDRTATREDDFIATLSHELRIPLAPIRAAAKVIASPQVAPAQLQRRSST